MDYKELATLYHMDASAEREANTLRLLEERQHAPSTFDLGFSTSSGSLFLAVPRELTSLTQTVLRRERKVSNLMRSLPGIAGNEVLRSLVLDEVVMSNQIESIHSTRKQIEEALEENSDESPRSRRFREFAKLYIDLSYGEFVRPKTPEDIRLLYDKIMDGEPNTPEPDGVLFRKEAVYVTNGVKSVHQGILPEQAIHQAMKAMLELVYSPEIPELYSALVSHYVFEYAHPFYDGNGRTGRYLLSAFLETPLSKPTALSLSRAIAENKHLYYQAFRSVEDPLNHGEATFFVIAMHELILRAQDELIEKLERNIETLDLVNEAVDALDARGGYSEKELTIIFGLLQQIAFGASRSMSLGTIANLVTVGRQQTRKYMMALENQGTVEKTRGRNPVMFTLSDAFVKDNAPFLANSQNSMAN